MITAVNPIIEKNVRYGHPIVVSYIYLNNDHSHYCNTKLSTAHERGKVRIISFRFLDTVPTTTDRLFALRIAKHIQAQQLK